MSGLRVELDTRKLDAGCRKLVGGIEGARVPAAQKAASQTAARMREVTPVDTGALKRSIRPVRISGGAEVHYGTGLRYAWIVNARDDIVETGTDGVEELFRNLCEDIARQQTRRM